MPLNVRVLPNLPLIVLFTVFVVEQISSQAAETNSGLQEIEFNRDIRPILSDNCYFCHGPDKNKRQADLRLDVDPLTTAGNKFIIPGNSRDSELVHRITSLNPDQVMPPADSGKSLKPEQVELLKRWIDQGAKFEGHWAFLPIKRPAPPVTNDTRINSAKDPIDAFVVAGLAGSPLKQTAEADRITLLRRLSFDLIGLPPTPEDVAAFVSDKSENAYERVVDRLLDSPHYGERMAMWWLDLVRYADSVGYHGDQEVKVSPFRRYVIDAFNANKPFDQFTVEQLAGDLLPNPTRDQKIASGYNRLGMMSAEGGVQPKEYLAKYIAERVRNASGTWLGVTLGCAECHNHKYDPFTTQDFYRFEAFFADIKEQGLYNGASADGNFGPFIKVPDSQQQADLEALDRQIADVKNRLNTPTQELVDAQLAWEKSQPVWTLLKPESISAANGTTLTQLPDGSILASEANPATETYLLKFKNLPPGITALRLEVLPDDSLPQKGPGRAGNGNFVLTEIALQHQIGLGNSQPVPLQNASASYEQTGASEGNPYKKWAVEAAIDSDEKGAKWGWGIMEKVGQPQIAIFETAQDLTVANDDSLVVTLLQNLDNPQHTIGRFRISVTAMPRPVRFEPSVPPAIAGILNIPAGERSDSQRNELAVHYRSIAPILEPARQQLAELNNRWKAVDDRIPRTLVTETVEPRMVRVLKRGNWMDDSGEAVTPAIPSLFGSLAPGESRLTRLDLARWMTAQDNPLTARVFANRIWKLLVGSGISRRVDDLGAQGDWPSHPLLLDYLAARFMDSGWDVKHFVKLIVMSEAYRRSSVPTHEMQELDPYNRRLARQGRFRLDAELVRDNALAISGLLVTKIGGSSVRPYQPPGYWAYLNFPTREWQNGQGEELYRRGLYTHWQRQYLHPSLLAFDAPSREECTADRARSNTPLQSLVLLNDPTYVEAARAFAEMMIRQGGATSADRLSFGYRRAVSREIKPAEVQILESLLQKHLRDYQADPNAAKELLSIGSRPIPGDINQAELAAWVSIARVILNLHETITRN